jgi:glucokinase
MPRTRIIAGDVGGTKTLLSFVQFEGSSRRVLLERRYESAYYPTFESLLHEFFAAGVSDVDAACLAVAGPVTDGEARVTNLPWAISAGDVERKFDIPRVVLVNDFYAVASAIPRLRPEDLFVLNPGDPDPAAPVAILGAGTGLGEAFAHPADGGWRVIPSEGGHADFAPNSPLERDLLARLAARYGHVSWERLLSGEGLVNIYSFLLDGKGESGGETPLGDVDEAGIPARISELAAAGDALALETFEVFVRIYAAEAGNLALKVLARGGVYLAGGIAARNLARFDRELFVESFTAKGRFAGLLRTIPAYVITNTAVGLFGAEAIALRGAAEE